MKPSLLALSMFLLSVAGIHDAHAEPRVPAGVVTTALVGAATSDVVGPDGSIGSIAVKTHVTERGTIQVDASVCEPWAPLCKRYSGEPEGATLTLEVDEGAHNLRHLRLVAELGDLGSADLWFKSASITVSGVDCVDESAGAAFFVESGASHNAIRFADLQGTVGPWSVRQSVFRCGGYGEGEDVILVWAIA